MTKWPRDADVHKTRSPESDDLGHPDGKVDLPPKVWEPKKKWTWHTDRTGTYVVSPDKRIVAKIYDEKDADFIVSALNEKEDPCPK